MKHDVTQRQGEQMSFWNHLDALRTCIIKAIIMVVVFGVLAFILKEQLFDIVLAPRTSDFITYKLMGSEPFSIHLMNTIHHCLWVGETRSFKQMASPVGQWPIVPVLNNIIHRDMAFAELSQSAFDVVAALVTLPTLPEPHNPLGIE